MPPVNLFLPEELSSLPLSQAIRWGVRDLKACDSDDRYVFDAGEWHTPRERKCRLCIAGAVMAKTLGIDHRRDATPSSVCEPISAMRLRALDAIQRGRVDDAVGLWYGGAVKAAAPLREKARHLNRPDQAAVSLKSMYYLYLDSIVKDLEGVQL